MFDVVDGKMEVFDFDGANRRTILNQDIAAGFDAVINSNNRYMYYVTKTVDGYSLKRDKLIQNFRIKYKNSPRRGYFFITRKCEFI